MTSLGHNIVEYIWDEIEEKILDTKLVIFKKIMIRFSQYKTVILHRSNHKVLFFPKHI